MDQPKWLELAWRELGQREARGAKDNPRIREYFRDAGHGEVAQDEVPWCAAFVGACLKRAGASNTGSLMARSYASWGASADGGRIGAVAVLKRGSDPKLGHVGFVVGETGDSLLLIGGNQSDAVTVAPFAKSRLVALRWPNATVLASPAETPCGTPSTGDGVQPPPCSREDAGFAGSEAGFAAALAHVFEMEGGFSDDPHDPGGPTHRGITLATFAAWRGRRLDDATRGALKAQLRRITAEEAGEIYRKRYWAPAGCEELARGIAFLHFDAAVNHGVGTAVMMLQNVAGATIDGEFGPETRAAALGHDPRGLLAAYAEARRRRYRALPHFWRFGRGWLNRVETTLKRALEIEARASSPERREVDPGQDHEAETNAAQRKGGRTMDDAVRRTMDGADAREAGGGDASGRQTGNGGRADSGTREVAPGKWWPQSLTVWGAVVTALSTVLPALAPLVGIDVTGDIVREAGEHVVRVGQGVVGLMGILMTVYGRVRAAGPLARKDVRVRF